MKTRRIRASLISLLKDFDTLNTAEIFSKLNDRSGSHGLRQGADRRKIQNVLGKQPVFLKLIDSKESAAPRVQSLEGDTYAVSLWGLNKTLLREQPELASAHRPKSP